MVEDVATAFLVGIAAGIALHRLLMALVLKASPDSVCAYCEWLGRKKSWRRK